jgi:hypothetical protein
VIHSRDNASWLHSQISPLNGRLVNLLAACRLYIDQTKHHLSGMNGPSAPSVDAFKDLLAREYDGSAGYRFMEALRNFVQHRGYPINGISMPSVRQGAGSPEAWKSAALPFVELDYLRRDAKFKKTVLSDIAHLGPRIDLRPLVREYTGALAKVQAELRTLVRPLLRESATLYARRIDQFYTAFPEEPRGGLAAVHEMDPGVFENEVYLFEALLTNRASLETKNQLSSDLARRSITNEVFIGDA